MQPMPKLDDVIQRALWSEMKDPAEFRAYLERAGYQITAAVDQCGEKTH